MPYRNEGMSEPPYGKHRDHALTLSEVVLLYRTFSKNLTLEDTKAQYRLLEEFVILLTDSEHSLDWPEISINGDS
jgi:tRNA splicing endonuclease